MGMWKNREYLDPGIRQRSIILAVTLAVAVILSPEAAGAAAFMGICLFALFMGTAFFREKSIRKLSEELDRILHGEEGLEISHFREGDLEILRDEIAKMTWTLINSPGDLRMIRNSFPERLPIFLIRSALR